MKRDPDLLRAILFKLEAEDDFECVDIPALHMGMSTDERREYGHILLLIDAGLVASVGDEASTVRLTNDGHDFIEAIRQDTAWFKTKELAEKAGAKTLSAFFDIAIAIGRQELRKLTGWEI